jgi:poly-gamma-glutamate synthesis protein (capsule biosynthesis protein)
VAGEVTTWSQLNQSGGRLIVRRGRPGLRSLAGGRDVLAVVPAGRLTPFAQTATVAGVDPLTDPDHYPLTVPGGRHHTVTTMTLVGDIMLGRRVPTAAPHRPGAPLAPLRHRLAGADLTVGNLESTLSMAGAPRQGGDSFAADPKVLGPLARAGFDVLSQANNHSGDYGPRALVRSIRRLDASPIRPVGAGRTARRAWRPVILHRHGLSFGFLAFNAIGETPRATATSPGAAEIRMPPRTGPLNRQDLARMQRAVRRLNRRVDVTVVLPHWGVQYTNQPVPAQRRVGSALIDAGADVVVGGHAHWVQGVETHAGHLIVNCLGNFIFDMDFSLPTREGVLLSLVFWDDTLRGAHFTPYVIGPDFAPRLAGPRRASAILARMRATSDPPFGR